MLSRKPQLLFFLPIGPRSSSRFVEDTLESCFFHYPDCRVLLLNDTGKADYHFLHRWYQRVFTYDPIQHPSKGYNTKGLFWNKICECFNWALDHLPFDFLLRIDDDSLVINSGIEMDLGRLFSADPTIGVIGQFRKMPDGTPVNHDWPHQQFLRETSCHWIIHQRPKRYLPKRLFWSLKLRHLVSKAMQNGWQIGEHLTGGALAVSRTCLESMRQDCLLHLPHSLLSQSDLGDDHLLSMLTYATNFRGQCVGGHEGLIGYRLDRLPLRLEQIPGSTFRIIHSVRHDPNFSEEEIRFYLKRWTRQERNPDGGKTW